MTHHAQLATPTETPERTWRAICNCGWQSLTCTNRQTAEQYARKHVDRANTLDRIFTDINQQ